MVNEKWWSVRELNALKSRLAELVDEAMLPSKATVLSNKGAHFAPPADLWETDSEVVVEIELPGVTTEQVELSLLNNSLHITGGGTDEAETGVIFQRIERHRGRFGRVISLPAETSGECRATLRRGVLEVRLTKAPAARRTVVVLQEEA